MGDGDVPISVSICFWNPAQVKLTPCGPRHQDGLCQACGFPEPSGQPPSCEGIPRAPELLPFVQVSDQCACHLLPALFLSLSLSLAVAKPRDGVTLLLGFQKGISQAACLTPL